jgi:hypothetical protein
MSGEPVKLKCLSCGGIYTVTDWQATAAPTILRFDCGEGCRKRDRFGMMIEVLTRGAALDELEAKPVEGYAPGADATVLQPIRVGDRWIDEETGEVVAVARIVYVLTARDQRTVDSCAAKMFARGEGRRDRQGQRSLESHRRGAAGELAFARLTSLPFDCKAVGFSKPDVGPYQVRTSSGSPYLVLHENDGDGTPAVAMLELDAATYRIAGWLRESRQGKRPEWWRNPGDRRPAFFVPYEKLEVAGLIPELGKEGKEA